MATLNRVLPGGFSIGPMRLSDMEDVMEIERRSHLMPWSQQVFAEELGRDWAHLDVVREEATKRGRVVAFCNYWHVQDEVHLLNIAVHPEKRNQRIGGWLMSHLIEFATSSRACVITLEVRASNTAALALYKKQGFQQVGIRRQYYVADKEDALVMTLMLPQKECP